MADRQHQGARSVHRRGMSGRATAVAALVVAASLGPAAPAIAKGCVTGECTVSTGSTSTSTSTTTTTTTSTTTSTSTQTGWNTILTGPSAPLAGDARPVVMTEAQRIAQLATGIQRDIYGAIQPAGCGGAPPAAPCPTADPAAPTVQQVGNPTTTTTTATNTTRRTTVSVQELAERAKAKIKLAKPNVGSAPCTGAGCQGAVGIPVWLWTQALPTQSESASAGSRTVTVSDKVTKVTWDLGNGTTITCNGSGTAYDPSMGWATSPDCGVPNGYPQAGRYTVTATFHHEVTYTGVNLPAENVTSTTSTNVTIGEYQAIGVKAGG